MPITTSEFLLQNKKLLVLEALFLLPIPLLWSFGGRFLDAQTKLEISTLLLVQLIATLSLLSMSLFVACIILAAKLKDQNVDIEHRRNLVARWRKMVHEIAKHSDNNKDISTSTLLKRHEDYYSLRPDLSHETIRQVSRTTTFIAGSTISTPLKLILDNIDRIEKEWHLI